MKKLLSVLLIAGSIITTVMGVLVVLTEIELLTFFDFALTSAEAFAVGILLIFSPLFATLLLKKRVAGGIIIILSSILFLVFISGVQTDDLTVDPTVNTLSWVVQIAMVVIAVAYWFVQRSEN